jgi:hypothetical protein
MAYDKDLKKVICAKLAAGFNDYDTLEEEFDVPASTIKIWDRKVQKELEAAKVLEVVHTPPAVLDSLVDDLKDRGAPESFITKAEALVEGAIGLQSLEPEFQKTVTVALLRVNDMLSHEHLKSSELVSLTKVIGELYQNLFINQGTNVQILNQNNAPSGTQVSAFKQASRI